MKNLSEIYDLVKKGELKNGDVVTFVADVLTKKETNRHYFATFTNNKNIIIKYYGKKALKPISSFFSKLKINKTFVIKGALSCSEKNDEFSLDSIIYANGGDSFYYRLKYIDTGNPLYKLFSYLANDSESAACEFFFKNKEIIMNLLRTGEESSELKYSLISLAFNTKKIKSDIINKQILSELIKENIDDCFGENLLGNFIYTIFLNADIENLAIKLNAVKFLYDIIDEIPDEVINFVDDNGDNIINLLCSNDLLCPIVEKLLDRNVSFDCVNDVGFDSLAEAIRRGSKTIAKLIVESGKVKATDEHKKLAEKYNINIKI